MLGMSLVADTPHDGLTHRGIVLQLKLQHSDGRTCDVMWTSGCHQSAKLRFNYKPTFCGWESEIYVVHDVNCSRGYGSNPYNSMDINHP